MYRTLDWLFHARIPNFITIKAEANVIYWHGATQFNKGEYAIIFLRKFSAQVCRYSVFNGARNLPVSNETIVGHGHLARQRSDKQ